MSDDSVAAALSSAAKLVVVEAPAGCGKTYQGAEYAREAAVRRKQGRVLILTHTHAACDVFAARTRGAPNIEIRTIDGLVTAIAAAYHRSLGLPADAGAWARTNKNGYQKVAGKVADLLTRTAIVASSLAKRYPVIVCDEHQDASVHQHTIVSELHRRGSLLRIFADPMQRIYGRMSDQQILEGVERWKRLRTDATAICDLAFPHRWSPDAEELGSWILFARDMLRNGRKVSLRQPYPRGLRVVMADNIAPRHGAFIAAPEDRKAIYRLAREPGSLLVLTTQNATAEGLRSFFGRSLPIWEGHIRQSLDAFVQKIGASAGSVDKVCSATIEFIQAVASGFSASVFGDVLLEEVSSRCTGRRRGLPEKLQLLGRTIVDQPTHKGVATLLRKLHELASVDPAFARVKIDYPKEYWDAIRLERFDDPSIGLVEIARRRSYARLRLPEKAISTVHKAKGHECDHVIIMPCDEKHFPDKFSSRCLLYVAMSRPMRSLTFVIPRTGATPLIELS